LLNEWLLTATDTFAFIAQVQQEYNVPGRAAALLTSPSSEREEDGASPLLQNQRMLMEL